MQRLARAIPSASVRTLILSRIGTKRRHSDIVAGILRREPEVDFELPQGFIPEGMKDPEVLAVAASLGRILVTHDVRTMPHHFGEFIADSESPGLILVPRTMPMARAIEEILLIWHLSEAEEWTNRFRRLPL